MYHLPWRGDVWWRGGESQVQGRCWQLGFWGFWDVLEKHGSEFVYAWRRRFPFSTHFELPNKLPLSPARAACALLASRTPVGDGLDQFRPLSPQASPARYDELEKFRPAEAEIDLTLSRSLGQPTPPQHFILCGKGLCRQCPGQVSRWMC